MRRVVYNNCFGGFCLSVLAVQEMAKRGHRGAELALIDYTYTGSVYIDDYTTRWDPILVQVVEELGAAADGECADLRIGKLDDKQHYIIHCIDGKEKIEVLSQACHCCAVPRHGGT